MRFLIACDKFKGTLDSLEVGHALAKGITSADSEAEVKILAVSDGGQGFLQSLNQVRTFKLYEADCRDALGRGRTGWICWDAGHRQVFIESAQAIGLPLLEPDERNPWLAHSAGLGDLIHAGTRLHPKEIIIGLGGSASCDGGLGCLSALGWRFFDAQGRELPGIPASLALIRRIGPAPKPLPGLKLICDVKNPPVGQDGGVRIYSPQKGADPNIVEKLETGMRNWIQVLSARTGHDLTELFAGGAAGCLGLGLSQLLKGELILGAQWILDQLNFKAAVDWADVVISGEGAFDKTSFEGKITGSVFFAALAAHKSSVLITGRTSSLNLSQCRMYSLEARDSRAGQSRLRSLQALIRIGQELGSQA